MTAEFSRPGTTVFFTGLSGAGKTTLALALHEGVVRSTGRPVTLLDGDAVRKHLCSELGFSAEDRLRNLERIGFVAAEVMRHGGIAICAAIAPCAQGRAVIREMVTARRGHFALVHVATPLEICERRDTKGLYQKARSGALRNFTGISDPYDVPLDADITIDASVVTIAEGLCIVLSFLDCHGWLGAGYSSTDSRQVYAHRSETSRGTG